MNDARLLAWLEATRRGLAEDVTLEALERARRERAELMLSLQATPAAPPSDDLALRLGEVESAFQKRIESVRAEIRDRVGELRRVRKAASGYRQPEPSTPSLISDDV